MFISFICYTSPLLGQHSTVNTDIMSELIKFYWKHVITLGKIFMDIFPLGVAIIDLVRNTCKSFKTEEGIGIVIRLWHLFICAVCTALRSTALKDKLLCDLCRVWSIFPELRGQQEWARACLLAKVVSFPPPPFLFLFLNLVIFHWV